MARIDYFFPVSGVHGRYAKKDTQGTVQRKKLFRDEHGRIIGSGSNESYLIVHPRDYEKKPLEGKQLDSVTIFGRASAMAKAEQANPERLAYWKERWRNQLQKGESDAPINPRDGKRRIYLRLDKFIQAVIQRELQVK